MNSVHRNGIGSTSVSTIGGLSTKRMMLGPIGVYNDGDFTAEQIAEFREVFNWFDKNHDEFINEIELGNAMRALGENPTQAELSEILEVLCTTKSSSYSSRNSARNSPHNGPTAAPRESFSISTSELPEYKAKLANNHQNHVHYEDELKAPDSMQTDIEMYRVAQYKIDFSQFLIMMAHKMQNPEDEKEIRDAFKLFDTENDGKIEKAKLMKAMCTVGEPLTKREVSQLFQQIGDKNETTIDYEDFMSFMLSDT